MIRYGVRLLLSGGITTPFGSSPEMIVVDCESEAAMKRLAAYLGQEWAASKRKVTMTPYGPVPEPVILHVQGPHGMISFDASQIRRIEPFVQEKPEADHPGFMQAADLPVDSLPRLRSWLWDDDDEEDGEDEDA